jgi:hypothetical protein
MKARLYAFARNKQIDRIVQARFFFRLKRPGMGKCLVNRGVLRDDIQDAFILAYHVFEKPGNPFQVLPHLTDVPFDQNTPGQTIRNKPGDQEGKDTGKKETKQYFVEKSPL